jgi:type III secretory pathway component EscR
MRKIAKKIAAVLVLVMLVNSLNSCFTIWAAPGEPFTDIKIGRRNELRTFVALGVIILPADLAVAGVVLIITRAVRNSRGKKMEDVDTFSELTKSLPETELISLMDKFNSLPDSYTETVNNFSEEEFSAIVEAFNDLSEAEVVSSMEALSAMSEDSLIATLNNLQHIRKEQ